MCQNEHVVDVPSAEPDSCGEKAGLLWRKNKVCAVLIVAAIVLIILGVIFVIVWFGFMNAGNPFKLGPGHFASTNYIHLRQSPQFNP